jgi:hypothetical protein
LLCSKERMVDSLRALLIAARLAILAFERALHGLTP